MANKDLEKGAEALNEGGSRIYELGFHLDPELPTEEVKNAYRGMSEVISKNGAIIAEGQPISVQLAYTISRQENSGRRDFDSAHFAWIVYETSAENHEEILTAVKADPKIIRFIDLITTKEAARHSEELRDLSLKSPEREPEVAAGEELDAALENVTV